MLAVDPEKCASPHLHCLSISFDARPNSRQVRTAALQGLRLFVDKLEKHSDTMVPSEHAMSAADTTVAATGDGIFGWAIGSITGTLSKKVRDFLSGICPRSPQRYQIYGDSGEVHVEGEVKKASLPSSSAAASSEPQSGPRSSNSMDSSRAYQPPTKASQSTPSSSGWSDDEGWDDHNDWELPSSARTNTRVTSSHTSVATNSSARLSVRLFSSTQLQLHEIEPPFVCIQLGEENVEEGWGNEDDWGKDGEDGWGSAGDDDDDWGGIPSHKEDEAKTKGEADPPKRYSNHALLPTRSPL